MLLSFTFHFFMPTWQLDILSVIPYTEYTPTPPAQVSTQHWAINPSSRRSDLSLHHPSINSNPFSTLSTPTHQATLQPKEDPIFLSNMAKSSLVLLLLSILYIAGTATSASTTSSSASATNFIKASCTATTYPALCVQSLSLYATSINQSPRQLIQTALAVSLDKAQSTKTFVYKLTKFKGVKPREKAAIKDCFEEIDDTVDRLVKSVKELKNMGSSKGSDFQWHISNVQTWISAGLTDENTCVDGFAGKALNGRIKNSIKARFVHVERVTSNALALINKFGSKY